VKGNLSNSKNHLIKTSQKEIVAFANASGGVIYIGITDAGKLKGIDITNRLRSQLQDIAYNCDPSIIINLVEKDNILAIEVPEGKTNLIPAPMVSYSYGCQFAENDKE